MVNLAIGDVSNCREVVKLLPGSQGPLVVLGWAGAPRLQRDASRAVWEMLLVCSEASGHGCKPSVLGGMLLPHRAVPEPGSHRSAGSTQSAPPRCHLLGEYPPERMVPATDIAMWS